VLIGLRNSTLRTATWAGRQMGEYAFSPTLFRKNASRVKVATQTSVSILTSA
jgi:hypothetical protein